MSITNEYNPKDFSFLNDDDEEEQPTSSVGDSVRVLQKYPDGLDPEEWVKINLEETGGVPPMLEIEQSGLAGYRDGKWYAGSTPSEQPPSSPESYKQELIADPNTLYNFVGDTQSAPNPQELQKGANETKTYRSRSGLTNGTESYVVADLEDNPSHAIEFTCNCGVHVTEESLPEHMRKFHGAEATEARYTTYKTNQNPSINEMDANTKDTAKEDCGCSKKKARESFAEEFGDGSTAEDGVEAVRVGCSQRAG